MIDRDTMKSLQNLSRLRLEPEEERNLASQLEQILEYFKVLEGYNTVDTDLNAALDPGELRTDGSTRSFGRENLESFAVSMNEGHFVVPRILGTDAGTDDG